MLRHLLNLIFQSFASIPAALGSTWLGITFPIAVAVLVEVIGIFVFGWHVVKENWKKATGIGFAALAIGYACLFAVGMVRSVYADHVQLVAAADRYKQRWTAAEATEQTKLKAITDEKDGEIGQLKVSCAYKEGASGFLQEQLAKQQDQLNTCLVQQKDVPLTRTYPISHDGRPGVPKMEYLLTTNVVRTPVEVIASCDIPVSDAAMLPMTTMGGGNSSSSVVRISQTRYKFSLVSPAWSPSGPLWVTMFFVPPVNAMPSCSFTAN